MKNLFINKSTYFIFYNILQNTPPPILTQRFLVFMQIKNNLKRSTVFEIYTSCTFAAFK